MDRVNRAVLPDGARVEVIEQGPLHNRLDISTPKSFVLRLYTFYFPGWRATIDGEEVDIEVAGPEGFITVWVPKGEHKVIVRFGDTGPRTAGWVISAAGLGVWVVAVLLFPRSSTSCLGSCFRGSDARTFIWLSSVFLLFLVMEKLRILHMVPWYLTSKILL